MAKAAKKLSRTLYLVFNSIFFGVFVIVASSIPQILKRSGEVAQADAPGGTYTQNSYYGQSGYYGQGTYYDQASYYGQSSYQSGYGDSYSQSGYGDGDSGGPDGGCDSDADGADCAY